MDLVELKPGAIIRGPITPEPIQVVAVVPVGEATQILGKGLTIGQLHDPILRKAQVAGDGQPGEGALRRRGAPVRVDIGASMIATLGKLLPAKRRGRISQVRPFTERLVSSSYHLDQALLERVLAKTGE